MVQLLLRSKKLALALILTGLASGATAADRCEELFFHEFPFGPEFTVTRQDIVDEGNRNPTEFSFKGNPLKQEAWETYRRLVIKACRASGDCKTTMTTDKHGAAVKVRFSNGFYFTFGRDVAVLEANARPSTMSEFAREADKIDKYFFELARAAGIEPHERAGNGHIHLSRAAFAEQALAFRNFFVDFQNRPELIFGVLGNHLLNSPPLAALKPGQRDALEAVLREFDAKSADSATIDSFVKEIETRVYTETFYAQLNADSGYFQAINMTRMGHGPGKATLEIRSFRPQENVHVFLLELRLLDAWVRRLSTVREPLPYARKDRHIFTPQEQVDSFYQLIRQLDLSWDEFKILLPKELRDTKPTGLYQSVPYEL